MVAAAMAVLLSLCTNAGGLAAQQELSPHGRLSVSVECTVCHTTAAWSPARADMEFDHAETGFALAGLHEDLACSSCHLDLRFDEPQAVAEDCASCHFDVHLDAFVQPCAACHTTAGFHDVPALEVHTRTTFPLSGAHLQVSCETCHQEEERGPFGAVDPECVACHLDDYGRSTEIDHGLLGFSENCTQCHNTLAWTSTPAFDHRIMAGGFELVEAHGRAECGACHVVPGLGIRFDAADQNDCVACHRDVYQEEHGEGFPDQCSDCHGQSSWDGADFTHEDVAGGFELVGRHDAIPCTGCHTVPGFGVIHDPADQRDCVACHRIDFDGEHGSDGYPTDCVLCHTNDNWSGQFDHGTASNGFVLAGAHRRAQCTVCHSLPDLTLLVPEVDASNCVGCHQPDFDRHHAGTGFSTTCLDCHTTETWQGADFDHAAIAGGFALVGAHEPLLCASCHTQPGNALKFSPPPAGQNDCVACHRPDYDVEHAGTGFSTNCLDCHTPSTWTGAAFDHASAASGFRLIDPHDQLQCAACHVQPGNGLLFNAANDQDCVACHQSDFNAAHGGDPIPTTCLTCHASNTWSGAQFDHNDYFPIYSGAHKQETWGNDCTVCHANPVDYRNFSCLSCHEHRQTAMDDKHSEEPGYTYLSSACYSCHQNGKS